MDFFGARDKLKNLTAFDVSLKSIHWGAQGRLRKSKGISLAVHWSIR